MARTAFGLGELFFKSFCDPGLILFIQGADLVK